MTTLPPYQAAPPSVPPPSAPGRRPKSPGLAVTAIVLGALSLAFSWVPIINIIGIIVGFAAIIVGLLGLFFSRRVMSVIGIALALVGIIAAFAVNNSVANSLSHAVSAPPPNTGSQPLQPPGAPAAQDPNALPLFPGATNSDTVTQAGQAITTSGLTLTSSAVKLGRRTFGKSLCTAVTYSNGTNSSASFNEFDWKLQDPNGVILSPTFSGSVNTLNSGEIAPGGKSSGDVCFDNKSNATGQYVVLYESPSLLFSGARIAWLNRV